LLNLIRDLLENFPNYLTEYIDKIRKATEILFFSEKTARTVCVSFQILNILYNPEKKFLARDSIQPGELFERYMNSYIQKYSKLSTSVKGDTLQFLGNLIQYYSITYLLNKPHFKVGRS